MSEPSSQALIKKEDFTLSRVRAPRPAVHDSSVSSVSRNDILFALFKHKKKIFKGTIAGLAGAVAVYFFYPPVYESQAKLLVRYLVERSTVDTLDSPKSPIKYEQTTDTVIGSEIEILSSWDLAVQAAEAVGAKRFGAATKEAAARTIAKQLTLSTPHKGSNIIFASYTNRDPALATLVLSELVNRYFNKHLEVHRSAGAFDFVTQQTDQVRARLNQTEDGLKELKQKAGISGIMSLDDATKDLSGEATKTEEQLHLAEAELAEQQARVQQISGLVPSAEIVSANSEAAASIPGEPGAKPGDGKSKKPAPPAPVKPRASEEVVQKYQALVSGLQRLRQAQLDLFAKYTPENRMVKVNQAEIDSVENQRRNLEQKYPDLPTRIAPIGSSQGKELDPGSEAAHLAGVQAKRDALASLLHDSKERIQQLVQLGPQIAELERQKQMQEDNYKYFETTLEKARVDEALDPSKIPNISAVQRPSPPFLVTSTRNKIMLGSAVGGLALAVGFALLKELFLSRAVRRPVEVEKFVGISPLLSIAYDSGPNTASASNGNGKVDAIVPKAASRRNLAPWDAGHFIRPYAEAIRDRLGLYFELHQLTHKPKLVGVAGVSEGAGTSTLAAGLAAALSDTNEGKVLLVDANLGPNQVHPFFKGKPAYPLNAALKPNGPIDAAAENLYLATVGSPNSGLAQLGLKKFFDLMPNLKASDFDYIIFDMPPLNQTSPTWGMAAFMDKVLLVVEAEKSTRDAVRRGYLRLMAERDNVSIVLNKARSYGPSSLELET
jgi:polysaccharide biosynthesis transport protein